MAGGSRINSVWLVGRESSKAGVSVSCGVSLSRAGTCGAGMSGMKAGGGATPGEAGMAGGAT